jgi:uncharacterized protein (TIGR00255 family)
MTGYGRGEQSTGSTRLAVEIKAVNRKQLEIQVNVPRELDLLENRVRERVGSTVARGRVEVRVSLTLPVGAGAARLNAELAQTYAVDLRRLAAATGVDPAINLELLLRLPGVIESAGEAPAAEQFWPLLESALQAALVGFEQMRRREGEALAADLAGRVAALRSAVCIIETHAPTVLNRYRETLIQRLRSAGIEGIATTDERLLKEVVLFADRSDIAEELARLKSHFGQFDDCLQATEPVGRKLDFLAQEMNREINTIGSKANDALISMEVVHLKTELERFREQAQNVE